MLHNLIKPKFFIPIHGEYRMLYLHKEMAVSLGMPEENCFILGNGDVLSLGRNSAEITDHVPAQAVLIDGSGTVDAEDRVLNDRIHLSEDGCLAIAITVDDSTGNLACPPSINSIGCFDGESTEAVHEAISAKCANLLKSAGSKSGSVEAFVEKRAFREQLKNFVASKTSRRPMIICNVSHVSPYDEDAYYGDV